MQQKMTMENHAAFSVRNPAFGGVFERMFREGYLFDFFQVVRLLENLFPEARMPGESFEFSRERIRLRPHSGLVFPATDIRTIEYLDGDPSRVRLTVTFMGLYGVDSPLPVYFYTDIATESERTRPLREFLDIFNHRFYSLFYRSWKKYRPTLHYLAGGSDAYSQRTLCLAGLGTKNALNDCLVPPLRLAAFAGRLSCRIRNSEGLECLLADFLEGIKVAIVENVPRWVGISERPTLSKDSRVPFKLGMTAAIGEKIFDLSGKFRVVLGPLGLKQYLSLLPGSGNARVIHYLVRLYAPDYLDFDAELRLRTAEIPPLRLGDKGVQLGLTSWSGRPRGEVASRLVGYEENQTN